MFPKTILPYVLLTATIVLSVYSQLMIKWRMSSRFCDIHLPEGLWDKFLLLLIIIFDPGVFSGLVATFLSGLFWMATMSKLDISFAYPFTSLGFVLVLLFSAFLFGESMNMYKIVGVLFIMLGVTIASRG